MTEESRQWKIDLKKRGLKNWLLHIPIETYQNVRKYAFDSNRTMRDVVNDAIEFYLFAKQMQKKEEKEREKKRKNKKSL